MIEGPPTLTIRRKFDRPSREAMETFQGAMTGHIVDAMDGRGSLDPRIKPQQADNCIICGPALTCHAYPADNLALLAAVDVAEPGDVIVCATDSFQQTAVTGDLLAGMLKNKGATAIVTDGTIRDQVGVEAVGLPIFHSGVTPNSPASVGPGTIGLPVTCGGVRVQSGDLVIGDRDGVVIVPADQIAEVSTRLERVRSAEKELEAKVMEGGLTVPDHIRALLSSGAVQEVD